MKTFSQFQDPTKDIKLNLAEASILKPDYVIGHKFMYKGGIKEMDKEGTISIIDILGGGEMIE